MEGKGLEEIGIAQFRKEEEVMEECCMSTLRRDFGHLLKEAEEEESNRLDSIDRAREHKKQMAETSGRTSWERFQDFASIFVNRNKEVTTRCRG